VSIPAAWPKVLDFFGTPLVIELSPGQLSSDAGLLPICQFDQRVGLTRAFAAALDDPPDPDLTKHSSLEMVRSRVYGILAGYADQNDHNTLRHDPVFKLVADRSPEADDLASQPSGAPPTAAATCVPVESRTWAARQRHFRLRRQCDPLGEGHPCTWRMALAMKGVLAPEHWSQVAVDILAKIFDGPGFLPRSRRPPSPACPTG
jgi:hypothetical protein